MKHLTHPVAATDPVRYQRPATAPIAIRFGLTAYPPTAAQTTKGKK